MWSEIAINVLEINFFILSRTFININTIDKELLILKMMLIKQCSLTTNISNQSENAKYILISVCLNKISKRYLCVRQTRQTQSNILQPSYFRKSITAVKWSKLFVKLNLIFFSLHILGKALPQSNDQNVDVLNMFHTKRNHITKWNPLFVLNLSEECNYNPNLAWTNKIPKIFLCGFRCYLWKIYELCYLCSSAIIYSYSQGICVLPNYTMFVIIYSLYVSLTIHE